MRIKAMAFDIGHTLVDYRTPLNWRALYRPALMHAMAACGVRPDQEQIGEAEAVLLKYNTRVNPREHEVSSEVVFAEMLARMNCRCADMPTLKREFYGFFKSGAKCYGDAESTLIQLKRQGIAIGALTDVAYGMDDEFSLADIDSIRGYFDAVLTSVNVGYRKPHPAGYLMLLDALGASPEEMLYIGDEQKDIEGARRLSIRSALIDRGAQQPIFGQDYTIEALSDILNLI